MRRDALLALLCGVILWRIPSATHAQATDTPLTPGIQQWAGWTERVCVSSDHDQAGKTLANVRPCVVGQGDQLMAFWVCGRPSWRGDVFPRPGPWLAKAESADGGSTWSPARWVTPFIVEWFHLQWVGNTAHLAYSARIDPANWSTSEVFYARSDDDGDTWSAPVQLSFSPDKDFGAYSPGVLAEDETTVHVAWYQKTLDANADEIRYRSSGDGGGTWGTTQALGPAFEDHESPLVLWQSGPTLWAAFGGTTGRLDRTTFLCASRDHGRTWSPAQPIPFEGPPALQRFYLPWGPCAVANGSLTVLAKPDDDYVPGGALICANVDPEQGVTSLRPLDFQVTHLTVRLGTGTLPASMCSVDGVHQHDREIHLVLTGSHVVSPDDGRSWSLSTPLPLTKGEHEVRPAMLTDLNGTHIVYEEIEFEGGSIWHVRRPPSSEVDMIPPAPVADLSARHDRGKIILRFTAPGDDGTIGTASRYFLRYNQTPLASENWQAALDVTGEPAPTAAGEEQSMEVATALPAGTYHFGIISQDDVGNVSLLSNDAALDVP